MDEQQQEVINKFFTENYQILLQKCRDYARVYNYKFLEPDEIISELYLYTLNDYKRTSKLQELICLSAITINKTYKYSNLAMYYIARILYNLTHGHRTFDNKYSEARQLKIVYCYNMFNDIQQDDYEEQQQEYTAENILLIAKRLGIGINWWKYVLWKEKYVNKKTYKQIAKEYHLHTTPIFNGVKTYNQLIKEELLKNNSNYEK